MDSSNGFTCDFCEKIYTRKSSLKIHKRLHSGENLFKCDVCGKNFPRKDHLKQHMLVHSKQ